MIAVPRRLWVLFPLALAAGSTVGCASAMYSTVVKPVPQLSMLSPELANLTDSAIETYLTADVRPVFPAGLAVAKVVAPSYLRYRDGNPISRLRLETITGTEAEGWQAMVGAPESGEPLPLDQVQFVHPMLVAGDPTLKNLRNAAALLHAPLLFVYVQDENSDEGYNPAAMAYWTIVGLFCVPGNTVGHCTVGHGLLIDTRSGFVLATARGESLKEENVLPGAVRIAAERTGRQSRAQAVEGVQASFRKALTGLTPTRGGRVD